MTSGQKFRISKNGKKNLSHQLFKRFKFIFMVCGHFSTRNGLKFTFVFLESEQDHKG